MPHLHLDGGCNRNGSSGFGDDPPFRLAERFAMDQVDGGAELTLLAVTLNRAGCAHACQLARPRTPLLLQRNCSTMVRCSSRRVETERGRA